MPATQRMTADAYLATPSSPDRRWLQLVEGELIVDNPLLLHQAVKGELEHALRSWVRCGDRRGLVALPLDVKLDEHDVGFRRSRRVAPAFDMALELQRADSLTSTQLEGFELPLSDLFPE